MSLDYSKYQGLFDSVCTARNHVYTYGTAGFRDNAKVLNTVMFTTGLVACLRSIALKGEAVGVVVTASHNPPQDNGVKIVEPDGSMLDQAWEPLATKLANMASSGNLQGLIEVLNVELKKYNTVNNTVPSLIVGRDSRESSPYLLNCVKDAASLIMNAKIIDYQLLTTPQLHFLTNEYNKNGATNVPLEESYYLHFSKAWDDILILNNVTRFPINNLVIDTANGIGGPKMEKMLKFWNFRDKVSLINNDWMNPTLLNKDCGADYVKTNQKLPANVQNDVNDGITLHCSFDGDADRVVFYYKDIKNNFHLLDGDKISTLFAKFIGSQLQLAGISSNKIKLGVVQTAYANGSSTSYIESTLNVPVACAKTGVKHLHHEAQKRYDIGIYFEANGHGTIIFSKQFYSVISEEIAMTNDESKLKYLKTLRAFSYLINQTVGDAISDMMGVICVLAIMNLAPSEWDHEYTDLPNKLAKLIVPDRSVFITTDQERKLLAPNGLQKHIDDIVKKYENGRSFVRASGTEDAVRIYAEAQRDVEQLSEEVMNATRKCVE